MHKVTKVMVISFITNTFLSILKIVTGIIGSSSAIIADGIHSLSDLITDIIAIFGSKISTKPADDKHPYGHGKVEYLTSIIISSIIISLGVSIIINSFSKPIVTPSIIVIIVTISTILIKLILAKYITNSGKKLNNSILIASGKESSTDVISSIVVLISSILMQFENSLFKYADIIATIIVGLFIIKIGIIILKENISNIIDEQVLDLEYINELKRIISEETYIKNIDKLIILKNGPYYKLQLEIRMDGNQTLNEAHQKSHLLEQKLMKIDNKLKYINIHINSKEVKE